MISSCQKKQLLLRVIFCEIIQEVPILSFLGQIFIRNGSDGPPCGLVVVRVPGYRSWGPGFDSWYYQIFWKVLGLERDPLSLVSKIQELLGRKGRGSGLKNREYSSRDPLCWPCNTLHSQKLALTSPSSSGSSVGIVRSRTQATDFVCLFLFYGPEFSYTFLSSPRHVWALTLFIQQ
jgi:hypothetical protein